MCLNFERLLFCKGKNISFLQEQHSQHILGHFVQCEMSLHKRIYGLKILDGQMDLPIILELQEVGQRRNCWNSLVICRHLSFVNEDLLVLLLLFAVHSERLYDLPVPNAAPCLFSTVSRDSALRILMFMVCSIVWSDATQLKQPSCLLTMKFLFLKKKLSDDFEQNSIIQTK